MDAPYSDCPISFNNCKSLRTIATYNCPIGGLNPESLSQLKCLRTLNLRDNHMEQVPEEVGGLLHLRYLDLSNNRWERLPDTLCNLINLETLRLEGCDDLEELPEGMGKLTNLRHLHVRQSYKLKLPKSIAKLTSLQTLDQVNIYDDGFQLSDLKNMDQLQGKLEVNWRDAAKEYAEQANLVNKKHLVSLKLLFWGGESDSIIQEEMLNALQPNPNVESLKISYYSGTTLCPRWMNTSLHNLKCVTFDDCNECEFVPLLVLGKLKSLELLQFCGLDGVKKVGFEYSKIIESSSSSSSHEVTLFPNLKKLGFDNMPKWEEWEGKPAGLSEDSLASIKVMPCLSTLKIRSCWELKTLPDFLWKTPLRNLSIEDSKALTQSYKNRGGVEWRKISHIPNIKIDDEEDCGHPISSAASSD